MNSKTYNLSVLERNISGNVNTNADRRIEISSQSIVKSSIYIEIFTALIQNPPS
jgi:hypothetical protein